MPIYEYACPKCKKVFSFLSKTLTPPRVPSCPKCGGRKMEKLMSRFAAPRGRRRLRRVFFPVLSCVRAPDVL